MFNIIERAKRRIKKLCEYHNRKADKYDRLAKHYAEKARQHRTAARSYMDAATTMEIETLDVSDCDWDRVIDNDLAERIAAAMARNDEAADKAIARTGDMKMSEAFAFAGGVVHYDGQVARAVHDLEKRNVIK